MASSHGSSAGSSGSAASVNSGPLPRGRAHSGGGAALTLTTRCRPKSAGSRSSQSRSACRRWVCHSGASSTNPCPAAAHRAGKASQSGGKSRTADASTARRIKTGEQDQTIRLGRTEIARQDRTLAVAAQTAPGESGRRLRRVEGDRQRRGSACRRLRRGALGKRLRSAGWPSSRTICIMRSANCAVVGGASGGSAARKCTTASVSSRAGRRSALPAPRWRRTATGRSGPRRTARPDRRASSPRPALRALLPSDTAIPSFPWSRAGCDVAEFARIPIECPPSEFWRIPLHRNRLYGPEHHLACSTPPFYNMAVRLAHRVVPASTTLRSRLDHALPGSRAARSR